ncbi:metal ABC transporter solute-binding protein, Zn/Mn family [Moraxella oblonga]|uniref:metal ABC transporter solute-binding protein, Zn/Mn family n=1 Tax=Moraxella oblonga TaxID=200413 RepID=UPI000AF9ECBC|nr:zinc ABC transporter substrate-binding protein [Moraxella oblonga]
MMKLNNLTKKIACLSILFLATAVQAGTVTVSNYPLALLSNAVTEGDTPAQVLLSAGDVGHHGSLSPSGVKLIKDSQFVVWFGQELEQNLVSQLNLAPNAISLYRFKAFHRLPLRELDGTPRPNTFDPHIWLDPNNAKAIVRALAVIHTHANPTKKELYHANAKKFAERMDKAVLDMANQKTMSYWAYHDSYQYLENFVKIRFAGGLTPDHHLSPKASQIRHLTTTRPSTHMCLLSQGNVSAGIINKLGNTSVLVAQEDMSDGKDFVAVWQKLAQDVNRCVGR